MIDLQTVNAMAPWPRRLVNFPIIIIAITQQIVWAATIAVDQSALNTTGVHILTLMWPWWGVCAALLGAALCAVLAFFVPRRIETLILLLPQQLLLYLSGGGAAWAIWNAEFADGVQRTHGFLIVDQVALCLIAIFHTWAIILIALYSRDHK